MAFESKYLESILKKKQAINYIRDVDRLLPQIHQNKSTVPDIDFAQMAIDNIRRIDDSSFKLRAKDADVSSFEYFLREDGKFL